MNGKPSARKRARQVHRSTTKKNHRTGDYLEIGSWRFEEDENGDLVIMNLETGSVTIFLKK